MSFLFIAFMLAALRLGEVSASAACTKPGSVLTFARVQGEAVNGIAGSGWMILTNLSKVFITPDYDNKMPMKTSSLRKSPLLAARTPRMPPQPSSHLGPWPIPQPRPLPISRVDILSTKDAKIYGTGTLESFKRERLSHRVTNLIVALEENLAKHAHSLLEKRFSLKRRAVY